MTNMRYAKCLVLAVCLAGACFGGELKFDEKKFELKSVQVGERTLKFRAYEGIVYVAKPASDYQVLNFYVPEGKFSDQKSAIFMPNAIGGYMSAKPQKPEIQNEKPNATLEALLRGYVVASVGARGRTLKDGEKFIGKAPAAIVDLKAAVRYLKFNDKFMPGDANKIISNGTSAGGAMSALLGASANAREYEPYLKELGAAKADDQIYAVSAYCPVTNLEHEDEAYEWMFGDLDKFERIDFSSLDVSSFNDRSKKPKMIVGELNATQKELGYSSFHIARLPLIEAERKEFRLGEYLAIKAFKFIPKGFFDEYRPMRAADIAKVIVQVAQDDHSEGVKIYSPVEYAK